MFPVAEPSAALVAASQKLSMSGVDERGAVFTRREVVDFILDLVDYPPKEKGVRARILEPSFGAGDFLVPVIQRLLRAFRSQEPLSTAEVKNAVRGVELHHASFLEVRAKVGTLLADAGFSQRDVEDILDVWLIHGDFLLTRLEPGFDYIVGNPPYVRQELIPEVLIKEYRQRFSTIFDRADIYIPFIEKSLSLLAPKAALGFICADRWMKNRYGGPLRRMVAERYRLKFYVDMVGTDAFHSEVLAYPAITILTREHAGATRLAHRPPVDANSLETLARELKSEKVPSSDSGIREMHGIAAGDAPWILESTDQVALLRRLENEFLLIEEAGCKIGIGVATGADKVFIAPYATLEVEESRKLPLVRTRDIAAGEVNWSGDGVVNPFNDDGSLVDLLDYPRLRAYFEKNGAALKARHVSKRNPTGWFRTIDRIYPALAATPKLLIPDIKGEAHIVYEAGRYYPHHNLYHITSNEWDLHALRAILLSGIARLFVATYSTKMHGGFLRFQAQYLRKIRLPKWSSVPRQVQAALVEAASAGNVLECNRQTAKVFRLSEAERSALGGNGI